MRVRFAPSPTGLLHLGGLRTALFNFILARKHNGSFILRIEDTDRNRFVPGSVESIISTLKKCGIQYDEGPDKQGDYGPYIQSERTELYRKVANMLLETGHAYRCFCSPNRLAELKLTSIRTHGSYKYDGLCKNLSTAEIQRKLQTDSYCIRMKIPEGKTSFTDLVFGNIEYQGSSLDDSVLLKSDGYPSYHLANITDDHYMKVSHVLRGEEWIPSTPKHLLLYKALDWEPPQFAHLPLLLNPDRTKLSKRSMNTDVEWYLKQGFLPEALINYISFLSVGQDSLLGRRVLSLKEIISEFDLSSIKTHSVAVIPDKLEWYNRHYIQQAASDEKLIHVLIEGLQKLLDDRKPEFKSPEYLQKVLSICKERMVSYKSVLDDYPYFFGEAQYDGRSVSIDVDSLYKLLFELESFTAESVSSAIKKLNTTIPKKQFYLELRYVTTGSQIGGGIFDTISILGKEQVLKNLELYKQSQQQRKAE